MSQLQITGHGLEITTALSKLIHNKFTKVIKHADKITSAHITLHVDKLQQIAEINLHVPGFEVHAKANSEDMYKTIDMLIDKVIRQLDKHKGKQSNHR